MQGQIILLSYFLKHICDQSLELGREDTRINFHL